MLWPKGKTLLIYSPKIYKKEAARVRQHYQDEARKIQSAANEMVRRLLKQIEPLRRFEKLKDALDAETPGFNLSRRVEQRIVNALEKPSAAFGCSPPFSQ